MFFRIFIRADICRLLGGLEAVFVIQSLVPNRDRFGSAFLEIADLVGENGAVGEA